MNSVVTIKGREKVIKARAEGIPVPKIIGIALGDGGTTPTGEVIMPDETQNVLNHELLRKQIDSFEYTSSVSCKYRIILAPGELDDASITEMALYDTSGDLVAIKNMKPKVNDQDIEMGFALTDSLETEVI